MDRLKRRFVIIQIMLFLSVAFLFVLLYLLAVYNVPYNMETILAQWYWTISSIILSLFVGYSFYGYLCIKKNRTSLSIKIANASLKYTFLLKQLVKRDFKRKYRRSILGVLWSFLNPLLMMGTQWFVFSTIFGNQSIEYYPVYLLIGIVTFNFFSESTSAGLIAITGNASLLNKVYAPRYVYTLSKIISSAINFGFSLIPLFIVILSMQLWPAPVILLFFVNNMFLFLFCLGGALILSTVMVFFRDMKFIWNAIRLMWMYATPIFYSVERIQNETFRTIIKFNPLYHFIKVSRTLIIDRQSANLTSYLWCVISAFVSLVVGLIVFKTQQEKFSLYV